MPSDNNSKCGCKQRDCKPCCECVLTFNRAIRKFRVRGSDDLTPLTVLVPYSVNGMKQISVSSLFHLPEKCPNLSVKYDIKLFDNECVAQLANPTDTYTCTNLTCDQMFDAMVPNNKCVSAFVTAHFTMEKTRNCPQSTKCVTRQCLFTINNV